MAEQQNQGDQDAGKGAVEGDGRGRTEREQNGNTSMSGQNPHRVRTQLVKDNDSDFPEPGGSPEHSGQLSAQNDRQPRDPAEGADIQSHRSPDGEQVNQDPGARQKENQSNEKDDPLAA